MSPSTHVFTAEQLDQDFRSILESIDELNLPSSTVYKLFAPLRWHLFQVKWIRRVKILGLLVVLSLATYYWPFLNWNASAVGRLAMIQVLPYWDWRPLYKEKCLLKSFSSPESERTSLPIASDCTVCENIETIHQRSKVSYDFLYEHHLLRSLPVVVSDSHRPWKDRSWQNVTEFLQAVEPLLLQKPCNMQSNLVFSLPGSRGSENILGRLADIVINSNRNDSWFVHFRNCELKSVKSTRLLVERPYFYAPHLEMPYTSWILLSNNYRSKSTKPLKMEGLIIVMQLRASIKVTLVPKGDCTQFCSVLEVQLGEGESLMFSTNLWNFEYLPSVENDTAITFVTETFQT